MRRNWQGESRRKEHERRISALESSIATSYDILNNQQNRLLLLENKVFPPVEKEPDPQ